MARKRPAWCSVSTPVMWSSTTTTSSTWPCHCRAKMPIVAEPQATPNPSSPRAPAARNPLPAPPADDGRPPGLDDERRAAVDLQLEGVLVEELEQRVAGD